VDGKSNGPGGPPYEQYYQKDQQQSQYRSIGPNGQIQVPVRTAPVTPQPNVKRDRIASGNGTVVDGQLVTEANAPKSGAQLVFVSAQRQSPEKAVTTNTSGRFEVELPQGAWLIYVRNAEGQQIYHSRIDVAAMSTAPIQLVSR
jgi:hypothetical protein